MTFPRTSLSLTLALTLAPTGAAAAQHAQPSPLAAARLEVAGEGDARRATAHGPGLQSALARGESKRPSAGRHALVGATCGLVASTALLLAVGAAYGNGGFPPIYVTTVVTVGAATLGAVGGLTVYGIKRLANR